jgi:hypothetical protein
MLLLMPPHTWVTPKEAAAILRLTTDALATRRNRGDWPSATKLGPRLVRYRLGDLLLDAEASPPKQIAQ